MEQITIGYLSWKRNDVFEQTLKSHQQNGLFDLISPSNRIIFFQETSQQDIELARRYNCEYISSKTNIGILGAFIQLVKACRTEYFIFSENDWNLIENKEKMYKILQDSIVLCDKNIIVKLRHRENPGKPLYSKPVDVNNWLSQDISGFPYKLESLSWIKNPEDYYKLQELEIVQLNYKWYVCTLEHQRWSNNIFICRTSLLKDKLEEIGSFDNLDKYTGLEDVLINHVKLNVKIAGGDGLFTHLDYIL